MKTSSILCHIKLKHQVYFVISNENISILCHIKLTNKHKQKVVIKIERGRINEAIYTTHVPFSYICFFVKNSFIHFNNIGFYVKL